MSDKVTRSDLDELMEFINKKKKEIHRLIKEIDELNKQIDKKFKYILKHLR